jgi:hypothetical protein
MSIMMHGIIDAHWWTHRDVQRDGPVPNTRKYQSRSPDELDAILHQLRLQYEEASAIKIDSLATKLVRHLGGDAVLKVHLLRVVCSRCVCMLGLCCALWVHGVSAVGTQR